MIPGLIVLSAYVWNGRADRLEVRFRALVTAGRLWSSFDSLLWRSGAAFRRKSKGWGAPSSVRIRLERLGAPVRRFALALTPFVRPRRHSTSSVLSRMDAKARAFSSRRAYINLLVEKLEKRLAGPRGSSLRSVLGPQLSALRSEEVRIAGFEADLGEQRSREMAVVSERSASVHARGVEAGNPSSGSAPHDSKSRSMVSAPAVQAGAGLCADRHDRAIRLFRTRAPLGHDVSARPVDRSADWFDDPFMRRLVSIVEIPGLAHTLLLAERRQRQVDLKVLVVPVGCLGLPYQESEPPAG